MADLFLIANPSKDPEKRLQSQMDIVANLVRRAEALQAQAIRKPEEIKALADEMETVGLNKWAKLLRNLLD